MSKFFDFNSNFMLLILLLTLTTTTIIGCQNTDTTIKKQITYKDKLSLSEEQRLVEVARAATLKKFEGKLSKEEINFIKETKPLVAIEYTNYKYGLAKIVWDPALNINLFETPTEKKVNIEEIRAQNRKIQKAFNVYVSGHLTSNKLSITISAAKRAKVKYFSNPRKAPDFKKMSNAEIMKSYAPLLYDDEKERERAIKAYDAIDKQNRK
ncbi:hypothetical protein AAEX28_11310 [Lentisphaerota bacterium WC36G]|nr:hypothetical protein LJT99_14145 [Lentisphaerae bacterium WC36]